MKVGGLPPPPASPPSLRNPDLQRKTGLRWWVPIAVEGVFLLFAAISAGSRGTHVHHSTFVSGFLGIIMVALLIGGPAFWSGYLYCRQHPSYH